MQRSGTPSFVLTLKLNTTGRDDMFLSKCFFYGNRMHNVLVSHARKQLSALRMDKEYREALSLYFKADPETQEKRILSDKLSSLRLKYGLSEYQFHSYMAVQQHMYSGYIDSLTAQKLASEVWKGVEAVLFRKGKNIHFRPLDAMSSIEGKNNASGIKFNKGSLCLEFKGHSIGVQFRKGDSYARQALSHRIKYCRIKRMAMGETYHYYVQLILEGIPPRKHDFLPSGYVGIDPGTSTEAVVSDNGCILTEIAPGRKDIDHESSLLLRKLDRSRRATNPDNYNPDGTPGKHRRFIKSKHYKKLQMRLKTLRRRNAAFVRQAEESFANTVLCCHGTDIITEPMEYSSLQKKSSETKISPKTGRYVSKKRFGKSLSGHAPARQLKIIDRKLGYMGKKVMIVSRNGYRASQYDHISDSYVKESLSSRSKHIGGHLVQRDLYSAFLLMCARGPDKPDRDICKKAFAKFLEHMNETIVSLLTDNRPHPSSMGLNDFKYLVTA